MKNAKRAILMPQYMKNFKCIGIKCEDTCCAGWNIFIDKMTYKKYTKCNNANIRKNILSSIKRNRRSNSDLNLYKINLINNRCPLLTQDGLCKIHLELGEEYLSNTCKLYPRTYNNVNNIIEISASFSCPEVCRLALLNKEPMEFDLEEIEIHEEILNGNVIDETSTHGKYRNLSILRSFTIDVLQDRRYSLDERLIILGIFYETVQKCKENNNEQEITGYIEEYVKSMDMGYFTEVLKEVPSDYIVQLQLLKVIIDSRMRSEFNKSGLTDCYHNFIKGLMLKENINDNDVIKNYMVAYARYYYPYITNNEYILENYLVNYVFSNIFPYGGTDNLFHNYCNMIILYSLIKMMLIGLSGYYKENFNSQHILKLIQSITKNIGHSQIFLDLITKYFKEKECLTLSHMLLLIKN